MAKERKKKNGQDRGKKNRRMRENVAERRARAGSPRPSTDQRDVVDYKPGSASDRTRRGAV